MAAADEPTTGAAEGGSGVEGNWLSDILDNFQKASDEALEIFYSAFNVSQAASAGGDEGLGWGSVNKEGEGRKQFYFGDPSEYDMSEINGPRTQWSMFKNQVKGFVQAIEWTEPWLIGLACFHLVILVTAVATRHNNTAQMVTFVSIMASVYMAERINTLAAANWERFSTQNYFDKHGVFVSTLWSTPLLLIGVVMLFQSLYNAASLLIQVKRRQIKGEIRAKHAAEKANGAAASTDQKSAKNESKKSK